METEIINGHPLTFYRYHPSKDIIAYYDYIKRKHPTFVELITLGFTFNSKPLVVIKVSAPKRNASSQQRPGVFILAGLSAHLWLPVASSLYILDNLVTNIANNDSLGEYIRKYDWFVLSLLNVDGYDYSMAFDRLWRKTRSEYISDDDSSGLSP
jgi:murein tripeptide amidase MpaA